MTWDYEAARLRGEDTEDMVADFFRRAGLTVQVGARHRFTDQEVASGARLRQRDLICKGYVIEVKGRPKVDFTGDPASWPWPDAILDEVYKWDAKPPPLAYVFCKPSTGDMLAVAGHKWDSQRKAWDHDRQRECDFYFVDKWRLRPIANLVHYLQTKKGPGG